MIGQRVKFKVGTDDTIYIVVDFKERENPLENELCIIRDLKIGNRSSVQHRCWYLVSDFEIVF